MSKHSADDVQHRKRTRSKPELSEGEKELKLQRAKDRKARNQRIYYQRHKEEERAKARCRAKARAGAKLANSDHALANVDSSLGSRESSAVTSPSHPATPPSHPATSPPHPEASDTTDDSSRPDFMTEESFEQEWPHLTGRRRMVAIRRWILDLEWNWGPVDRWGSAFNAESARMKDAYALEMDQWLQSAYEKIAAGRLILGYLSRVMEGSMSSDIEECRDLYLQGVNLTCQILACVKDLDTRVEDFRDTIMSS